MARAAGLALLLVLLVGCGAMVAARSSEKSRDSRDSRDSRESRESRESRQSGESGDADVGQFRRCAARRGGYDSVVCVCDARACDGAPSEPRGGLRPGAFLSVLSTRAGARLDARTGRLGSDSGSDSGSSSDSSSSSGSGSGSGSGSQDAADVRVRVWGGAPRQRVLGWGAAVTDSAAADALALSAAARARLVDAYFGDGGARYSLVRVPMAGTDFSTHQYSYDDNAGAPDPALANFTLAPEDTQLKIPFLHEAMEAAGASGLRLFTAPWGAPKWMVDWKDDGLNSLKPEYEETWAQYFVKFLDAYAARGLRFWGLSPQNEPSDGLEVNYGFNHLGWSPERAGAWVRDHLAPALRAAGYGDTSIMVHDDMRQRLPDWPARTLADPATAAAVSGVAVHWYEDSATDPARLVQTHDLFPDKFLLYTEACDGPFLSGGQAVQLGNWTRAENYARDIIQVSNNWVSGWVDWNLALDPSGGPTWVGNNLDAAVIVNATADEFLKQPTYYALLHFSRYVPPGSRAVTLRVDAGGRRVTATAFATPQGRYVVVLLNEESLPCSVSVTFDEGQVYKDTLPARSIQTLIVRPH